MNFRKILYMMGTIFIFSNLYSGISSAGWSQGHAYYPGGHMMGAGYMGWVMILFWALLLILLILVIRWILRLIHPKGNQQTALDILKKRLANGEIDIKEFKEKKQFL